MPPANGISAPVSRTITITDDEAAFRIVAAGNLDSTLQQVKQALQDAGLPNATVVVAGFTQDTSTYQPEGTQIIYWATVTLPVSLAGNAVKGIENLRTHLQDPLKGLQYTVTFTPNQARIDASRQAVLPQLMVDAQKLAQSLAATAGVKLGAVRSISDSASGYTGRTAPGMPDLNSFLFDNLVSGTQYTFYLSVIFAAVP